MKEPVSLDRVLRMDVHDYSGNLLERWKSKVADKKIGKIILLRVMANYNLTFEDITEQSKSEFDDELKRQKELVKN